jgi:hypothetical protein
MKKLLNQLRTPFPLNEINLQCSSNFFFEILNHLNGVCATTDQPTGDGEEMCNGTLRIHNKETQGRIQDLF